MHAQWLKDVDEQSASRDTKVYGNKPSTYCIAEEDEAGVENAHSVPLACYDGAQGPAVADCHAAVQQPREFQPFCASAEGMSESPRALTTAHAVAACLVQQAGRPLGYTCADVPALAAELSCYKRPRERYMDMPRPAQKLKKLPHGGAMAYGWQLDGWERPMGAMRAGGHAVHEPVSPLPIEDAPVAPPDVMLTPQTAALPRPLAGDGCVSPFQLSPREAPSSESASPQTREDADFMAMNEQEYLDFVATIFVQ